MWRGPRFSVIQLSPYHHSALAGGYNSMILQIVNMLKTTNMLMGTFVDGNSTTWITKRKQAQFEYKYWRRSMYCFSSLKPFVMTLMPLSVVVFFSTLIAKHCYYYYNVTHLFIFHIVAFRSEHCYKLLEKKELGRT